MNDKEVIYSQAVQLEKLKAENAALRKGIDTAISHIICIGGPLNDNKLQYSKEQLVAFVRIQSALEECRLGGEE